MAKAFLHKRSLSCSFARHFSSTEPPLRSRRQSLDEWRSKREFFLQESKLNIVEKIADIDTDSQLTASRTKGTQVCMFTPKATEFSQKLQSLKNLIADEDEILFTEIDKLMEQCDDI